MSSEYRTSPDHEHTGWPAGVPYIVGNEASERFSFYGMKAILYVHLAQLYVIAGFVQEDANRMATTTSHLFNAGVYAFPMIGAILADRYWGKYKTIFYLSLMYCVGHGILAVAEDTLTGMYLGLACIAIGAGGIKPCVSANVGDQFGRGNWFRVRSVYQIFYFSINFGSFFATLLIPAIRGDGSEPWRTSLAFGIPGILMAVATFFFWLGRHKFVHVLPQPAGKLGLLDTAAGTLLFMSVGHLFVSASWSLFAILGLSLFFLLTGIGVFLYRQKLELDDGFLAIVVYTVIAHLKGFKPAAPPAGAAGGASSSAVPAALRAAEKVAPPVSETSLLKSKLWAPAVQRFGLAAAEGPPAVFKVISIFIFIPIFWAIFDQHSSTWIQQADALDRTIPMPWASELHFSLGLVAAVTLAVLGMLIALAYARRDSESSWLYSGAAGLWLVVTIAALAFSPIVIGPSIELQASQIPALNPLMVMGLIIVMNGVYKLLEIVGLEMSALRRMVLGMFVAGASFAYAAWLQEWIDAAGHGVVHVHWQIWAYLILTVSEVMVSITALEFAYTQAPKRMKSTVLGLFLLTVTAGNIFVAVISTMAKDLPPATAPFFWFFAKGAVLVGIVMAIRAYFYKQRDFTQD
jgi:proton-dependent oligopeptide transporter, POT family